VMKDTVTGLTWQDNISNLSWERSIAYCEDLRYGGYSDWRLPNIYELSSVLDNIKIKHPFLINSFRTDGPSNFWSSNKHQENSSNIWYLSSYGYIGYTMSKDGLNYLRCVRGKSLDYGKIEKLHKENKIFLSDGNFDELPREIITDGLTDEERDDKNTWENASYQNTIPAYKAYLKQYPNGKYASSARSNIQYLEQENQFRALLQSKSPQTMYIEAGKQERNGNTSKATKLYEAIVDRFPNSDFAVKASDKLTGAIRAERAESNRRSQSRQECENNKNACLAGCGTYISGADSHNNAVWSCNDKCKQISCY